MTSFENSFQYREKEKVSGIEVGWLEDLLRSDIFEFQQKHGS